MKKFAFILALICTGAIAKNKPEVTYVGAGRYTCSGNTAQCAQIDQNNRALEAQQRAKDEARLERDREQRQREFEKQIGR